MHAWQVVLHETCPERDEILLVQVVADGLRKAWKVRVRAESTFLALNLEPDKFPLKYLD